MFLTKDQENILNGEKGKALAKCMELVVKIGDVNEAEKLIPIKSAQIAGVSFYTVRDAIFSFFDLLSKDKVKVSVPSWLNPAGMDMVRWREMDIDPLFAEKQRRIIQHYSDMGVETTLTCTPYLIGHVPTFGDHIAWSESSAVIMANSFFGARTNREGAPSSLASALLGVTADYGLHKSVNREPRVQVEVQTELTTFSDFSALGYWYGQNFRGAIPFFSGIDNVVLDKAKMLGSAMAASGSVALFHIDGFTPEAKDFDMGLLDKKAIFDDDCKKQVYDVFSQFEKDVDLVTIGCPHVSIEDLEKINLYTKGKSLKSGIDFWVFSSRELIHNEKNKPLFIELEKKGIKIFTDTCMVVSPVIRENYKNIITNSAKAAFYLTREKSNLVNLQSLEDIARSVFE